MDDDTSKPDPAEHSTQNISAASRAIMDKVLGAGRVFTQKHRENISRALRGRRLSAETRKKIGDAVRRAADHPIKRQFTDEHLAKLRAAAKARTRGKLTWEHRLKIKRALKGRRLSDETKEKIRAARVGTGTAQKREVTHQKLSASMKASHVIRKAKAEGGGEIPAWLQDSPEVQAAYDALGRKS